jgi:MFS-type transporter involved in bile tolerance (Atg22 family)
VWAATTAAVDAIARAGVATLVPAAQRGRAYGLYYAVFGVAWWLGSLGLGIAYDRRPAAAAILSATLLLAGAAVLAVAARRARTGER